MNCPQCGHPINNPRRHRCDAYAVIRELPPAGLGTAPLGGGVREPAMIAGSFCLFRNARCDSPQTCAITLGGCSYRAIAKPIVHPAITKQRKQMHDRIARDAKLLGYEIEERRRKAEVADARRNQPITRGEILDALDQTRHVMGGNVGEAHDVAMKLLDTLREAFE